MKAMLSTTVAALLFIGCGGTSTPTEEEISTLNTSSVEREMHPQASQEEMHLLAEANNKMAFDVYHAIDKHDNNHFASSYSTYNMLGMLSNGANGETREQMLNAMYIHPDNQADMNRQFNALDMQFSRTSGAFHASIANALWIQDGFQVQQSFLDTLAKNYGAPANFVDFEQDSEVARSTINRWTKEHTADNIQELIPQNALSQETKVVLTNAIYLKAQWQHSFAQQNTLYRNFHTIDEGVIQVPMMHQKSTFRYKEINGKKLLCMHYIGGEYRLLSIMPPEGEFENFEKNLNLESFQSLIMDPNTGEVDLQETEMELYYPKYEFENTINLVSALQQHGMTDAFNANADFSGITTEVPLEISNIIQKTFFKVDEEGTEAASSSTSSLGTTHTADIILKFNRPFIFILCHEPTQSILFLGRVLNPLNKE